MNTTKPELLTNIESIWGNGFTLHPAPPYPDVLTGLIACKKNHPKYALDKQGNLIGLNLADTRLNDEKWAQIVSLLEQHSIRLQALNVRKNQLQKFIPPPGISSLVEIDITDNPDLVSPPPDVVLQGKKGLLKWLQATGKRPVLEAKVMFIGDSNYGKSHLIEMLRKGAITREIKTTHGIERKRLNDAPSPEGNIRLNVWDLGGQQFMRSTHQFFFTERTLYVLVTLARTEREGLNPWLKLVHEIGGDAPVLVVINKTDLNEQDIDREAIQRDYPNIVGFVRTSIHERASISALETTITKIVSNKELMPSVFVQQRPEWFSVKNVLESMTEDFINFKEYQALPDVGNLPEEEQRTNLNQLATLGTVVSFVDDHRLSDTHVINPAWITDGVYRLINDPTIKDIRKGEFSFVDMKRLLNPARYPSTRYQFLVDLMEKFRLCYPVRKKKDTFLLPDLFIDKEPESVWEPKDNCLRLRFNFNHYLSTLFITQFIVERYKDIVDDKRWRNGVVVSNGACMAIVRRAFKEEHIEIEVTGPKNCLRDYLQTLLDVFRNLLKDYKNLNVTREIPYKDEWLNYDHLLRYEEKERSYYHPVLDEDIPVSEVLDGYRRSGMRDGHDEIIKKLTTLEEEQKKHHKSTHVDTSRLEKKINRMRRQIDTLKTIDETLLQENFSEIKELLDQAVHIPELQQIPALKNMFQQWQKNKSPANLKIVGTLLPSLIQATIPLLPNIQYEYEIDGANGLGRFIERLLDRVGRIEGWQDIG